MLHGGAVNPVMCPTLVNGLQLAGVYGGATSTLSNMTMLSPRHWHLFLQTRKQKRLRWVFARPCKPVDECSSICPRSSVRVWVWHEQTRFEMREGRHSKHDDVESVHETCSLLDPLSPFTRHVVSCLALDPHPQRGLTPLPTGRRAAGLALTRQGCVLGWCCRSKRGMRNKGQRGNVQDG
jgi:hypothetical protein